MSHVTVRGVAALVALLALTTACGGSDDLPPGAAATIKAGQNTFPNLANNHTPGPVDYSQAPPAGGPHNRAWLACAVYDEPVPNETVVHSLEHGAVWIAYRPGLASAEVDRLRELQRINPRYFVMSPYPNLDAPVVATAWGVQLRVDRASDERLASFVSQYAGGAQGGEPGADCVNGLKLDAARRAAGAAQG